jgi:hypothetical protein
MVNSTGHKIIASLYFIIEKEMSYLYVEGKFLRATLNERTIRGKLRWTRINR